MTVPARPLEAAGPNDSGPNDSGPNDSGPKLFRAEALQAQHRVIDAPLHLRARVLHWLASVLIVLVTLGGGWLVCQPYSEKLTVSGFAQRAAARVAVRAPHVAVVSELLVNEGDWVELDAALVQLSTDQTLADGRSLAAARVEALAAEEQALAKSRQLAQQRHRRALKRIHSALANGDESRSFLRQEHRAAQARWRLDKRRLEAVQQLLASGAVARAEHGQYQRQALDSQRHMHAAARALAEHGASQQQLQLDQQMLEQEQAESRVQIEGALARLQQRRIDLAATADQRLDAPVAGFVSGLNVRPGQNLQPGQLLLSLLDRDTRANVVLLLPSAAMGSVAVGQRVRLRYAGYPYQKYGMPEGQIERISRAPVQGADLELPVNPAASMYQVQVRVLPAKEPRRGSSFVPDTVASGMRVEADVLVRSDPLWRRGLAPLLDLWQRA